MVTGFMGDGWFPNSQLGILEEGDISRMAPVVGPVLTWKMMLRLEMRRQDSSDSKPAEDSKPNTAMGVEDSLGPDVEETPAKDSKPNTVMGVEDSQKQVRKLVFDPKRAMDVEDSDGAEEASPNKKRKFNLK